MHKILVIDDEETFLKRSQAILTDGLPNSQVTTFLHTKDNSEELKRLVQEQSFDVIITDNDMPNVNGVELAECIREGGVNQQAPIVMQTRGIDLMLKLQAHQAGIHTVLDKEKVEKAQEGSPNPLTHAVQDAIAEKEKSARKPG